MGARKEWNRAIQRALVDSDNGNAECCVILYMPEAIRHSQFFNFWANEGQLWPVLAPARLGSSLRMQCLVLLRADPCLFLNGWH